MQIIDASAAESFIKRFDIPPCPAVIGELQAELGKEDASATAVARLIGRDVGLAGAVVSAVNSPVFLSRRKVGSVAEALGMLGFGRIFDLVVSELLKKSIGGAGSQRLDRYWDSAACTADICAVLSDHFPGTKRDTAYCFGLFRDCGVPLMMRRFPAYRESLSSANNESGLALLAVEEREFGVNHAEIGYLLARTWGLSEIMVEAIRAHHSYDVLDLKTPARLPDEANVLIAIGTIAEHVTDLHLRTREEGQWKAARSRVAAFCSLKDFELDDLVEDLLLDLEAAEAR